MNQNPEDLRTAGLHRGPNHIDYRETADLTNVHGAVQREHSVGTPGALPVPLWLIALCLFAAFWAGTSFSGGFGSVVSYFSPDNYSVHPGNGGGGTSSGGGGAGGGGQTVSVADQGKAYFSQNCATCHQPNGAGVPGSIPPLAGSEYINGGSKRLGMILLKGVNGPITVEGKPFSSVMPPWEKTLTDKKISAILTYVRQDFGNHAGPIAPEQIADARKEFAAHPDSWHESDLQAVPPTAELPGGEAAPAPAPAAGGAK